MTQSKPRFGRLSWSPTHSQPRRLPSSALSTPYSRTGCSAQATSALKGHAYCASHLFKLLQQQWQE